MEEVKKGALLSSSPVSSDIKLETEGEVLSDTLPCQSYQPKQALAKALEEWLEEFSDDCDAPKKMAAAPAPVVTPPLLTAETTPTDGLPSTSIPLAVAASIGVANINELNGIESFMQPAIGPQANSLVDPPSDSETDSTTGPLEPMDCAISPSSSPVIPSCLPDVPSEQTATCSTAMDEEMEDAATLTVEDLSFLVDMFYTPFEHGSRAVEMLTDLYWLSSKCHILSNSESSRATTSTEVEEWKQRAAKFERDVAAFQQMIHHLCSAPNKALLFDLYPYIWDMKTALSLGVTYIKWLAPCAPRGSARLDHRDCAFTASHPHPHCPPLQCCYG